MIQLSTEEISSGTRMLQQNGHDQLQPSSVLAEKRRTETRNRSYSSLSVLRAKANGFGSGSSDSCLFEATMGVNCSLV